MCVRMCMFGISFSDQRQGKMINIQNNNYPQRTRGVDFLTQKQLDGQHEPNTSISRIRSLLYERWCLQRLALLLSDMSGWSEVSIYTVLLSTSLQVHFRFTRHTSRVMLPPLLDCSLQHPSSSQHSLRAGLRMPLLRWVRICCVTV